MTTANISYQGIATEIAIGGGNIKNRVTPVMIGGRYKVAKNDMVVSFDIKATQGETTLVSRSEGFSFHVA